MAIACKKDSVLVEHARNAGAVPHSNFLFKGGLRPRAWRNDIRAAREFILRERPDILHVSGSQDHWVFAVANRMLGFPVCLVRTRHNTYRVSDSLPNRILNRSWTDYQIVVCNVVRETLAAQRTFDGSRMCSIHNGVDAEEYQPNPAIRVRMREQFGFSEDHLVCGIAARLVEAKGHRFLFQAVADLRDELPNLRVLVLGQGDLEKNLKALAGTLLIADRVTFAGFRDDMAACVQAFDIGVQPSIDCDTSSFSLKEQMACRKPVIASDYGGLTEIVTPGEEGLIVPTGTVQPLADAIRLLAQHPERAIAMGRAGRQRVLRDFTVQVFASRTLEAYHRALEIHRSRIHP